jgi:hypothetical protein
MTALLEAPFADHHIHATPRAGRAIAPNSTSALIQAISEAERELECAQNDLTNIRSYLAQKRATVMNWSSPFATLPHELIRKIVSHTIDAPFQQRAILHLSYVSKRLRRVVLDMSWLFTEANWNAWPYPMVELWCQRAGTQLLTILAGDPFIRRLRDGSAAELRALLDACSSQWCKLEVRLDELTMRDRGVADAVEGLLKGSAPSLHTLYLASKKWQHAPTINFALNCQGTLRVYLGGVCALSTSPVLVNHLTFSCESPTQWSRWVDVLNSCPSLQKLTLHLWRYPGGRIGIDPVVKTALPSLLHLELCGIYEGDVDEISKFFRCFDIPNLSSITIKRDQGEGRMDLFWRLVRSLFWVVHTSSQHCLAATLDPKYTDYFSPQLLLVFEWRRIR